MNQKVTVNLSSPANTVCANKDGTKVAVAGRKSINIIIIFFFNYSSREMTVILLFFPFSFHYL